MQDAIGNYACDVRAWVEMLRLRTGAPCVWVLGHSEGGLVALAAGVGEPCICGLVLVATPGRPLGAVLREQLRANPANAAILDEALAVVAALEAVGDRTSRVCTRRCGRPSIRRCTISFSTRWRSTPPA